MRIKALLLAQLALLHSVAGFVPVHKPITSQPTTAKSNRNNCMSIDNHNEGLLLDRRSLLNIAAATTVGSWLAPMIARAEDGKKVVVMGGAGYVGSYVTTALQAQGFQVISASRSSASDQAARIRANTGKAPSGIQYESLDATNDDLSGIMKDVFAVVSCVGIPPWEKSMARAGNGLANIRIADAAKAAGVPKFVYVSVASEFSGGPAKFLFGEYFKGKAEADASISKDFGGQAVFVRPGFIDGAPPGEIRPPGPPGLPAISAQAVANAAVAGVTGQVSGSLDGYNAIMEAVAK